MNIGEASEASGLPAKTIRFYEEIGLITPSRGGNGYRHFNDADAHRLSFIARARSLGFSVDECRALLSLYSDRHRASADVKRLAAAHLDEIEQKIRRLEEMHATLRHLVENCRGDERPDCPILDNLAR